MVVVKQIDDLADISREIGYFKPLRCSYILRLIAQISADNFGEDTFVEVLLEPLSSLCKQCECHRYIDISGSTFR